MISYPVIDPVFLKLGPLSFRWYGLAYVIGVVGGYRLIRRDLSRTVGLNSDQISSLIIYIVLGILLGGRLGYVLIYDFLYFLNHPSLILAFWTGGMSYHGGAIGAAVSVIIFSSVHRCSMWALLDLLGFASTIGIAFGRIANFINGELYGKVTSLPWGMVFPSGGPRPRHPSQLYEAFLEGVVLFSLLFFLKRKKTLKEGHLFVFYLFFYGFFRFVIELFREPDPQLGQMIYSFSMGQMLSLLMILLSIFLASFINRSKTCYDNENNT